MARLLDRDQQRGLRPLDVAAIAARPHRIARLPCIVDSGPGTHAGIDPPDLHPLLAQLVAQLVGKSGQARQVGRDRVDIGAADAPPVAQDRPQPLRLAFDGIGDADRDGPCRLRQPELRAVAQRQPEIDRLCHEQRQRDQHGHLPGKTARPQPPFGARRRRRGGLRHSRVTSAASV